MCLCLCSYLRDFLCLHFYLIRLVSRVSCLVSRVSCLVPGCLVPHVRVSCVRVSACLVFRVSCFVSRVSCLVSRASCPRVLCPRVRVSRVSCLVSRVSCLVSACLVSRVTCHVLRVSCLVSRASCLLYFLCFCSCWLSFSNKIIWTFVVPAVAVAMVSVSLKTLLHCFLIYSSYDILI